MMIKFNSKCTSATYKQFARSSVSLAILGLLSACGASGTDGADSDSDAPVASAESAASAELTSSAQTTTAAELTASAELTTSEETTAVANPFSVSPTLAAAQSAVDALTSSEATAANELASSANTDSSTDTNIDTDSDTGIDANPDLASASTDTGNTSSTDSTSEPVALGAANSNVVDQGQTSESSSVEERSEPAQIFFDSVTTPGFEGSVIDDAIHITWNTDTAARGYNVYRQAQYYTTVFTNEYTDTDVYDDDYYYEIQAFYTDTETGEETLDYVATGLTVEARTLGRTDPEAPQPNENILDNYELVFSDEFNNSTLDTTKWNTSFLWGPDQIINQEEQYYVDIKNDPNFAFNPFSFDGENLTITTIETPAELLPNANNQPYLSGLITSYDSFKFTYGYAETRAKMTLGRGFWPAFWLLNAYYGDADPEIDIMEFIGHDQDVMYHTYHYFDTNHELRSTPSFPVVGIDFTADFHTFGVEWKPGTLIFYVDNIETLRVNDINVSNQEMYVLANQAVGGWWAGSPDESTPIPGKYIVDYIRVYQSIVPLDDVQFDQPEDLIPLFDDNPGIVLPNHRPPFEDWPEGYPTRQ